MGALDGLRVVEMGQLLAGPFCGQLLGDMGADVIKVEPPGAGDPMRDWGQGDTKVNWEVIARNKRSVSINLRVPEGQDIVRKLAAKADILIENFKPGTMEKWGLGPDALLAINPRLIIARPAMARPAPILTEPALAALVRRWADGAILSANQIVRPAAWAFPLATR